MRLIDADALKGKEVHGTIGDVAGDFIPAFEIALAPTIEAEPVKHGRWVLWGDEIYMAFKCSVCGVEIDEDYYNVAHTCCPNCGAKMDGDEEVTDG